MKNKKTRVDFKKLVSRDYCLEERLLVLEWMLNIGNKTSKYVSRWDKAGVDQLFFGYSANDHNSQTSLSGDGWGQISTILELGFFRTVVKNTYKHIQKWRESENILLGKYRVLPLKLDGISDMEIHTILDNLRSLEGKHIKKYYVDTDRYNVKDKHMHITGTKFSCDSHGFVIFIYYTSKCHPDGGWIIEHRPDGWNKETHRFDGESLGSFLKTIDKKIRDMVVTSRINEK